MCEKLVLDDPEALLSKTPEEITAVTQLLQKGTGSSFAVLTAVREALVSRCQDVEVL